MTRWRTAAVPVWRLVLCDRRCHPSCGHVRLALFAPNDLFLDSFAGPTGSVGARCSVSSSFFGCRNRCHRHWFPLCTQLFYPVRAPAPLRHLSVLGGPLPVSSPLLPPRSCSQSRVTLLGAFPFASIAGRCSLTIGIRVPYCLHRCVPVLSVGQLSTGAVAWPMGPPLHLKLVRLCPHFTFLNGSARTSYHLPFSPSNATVRFGRLRSCAVVNLSHLRH